MSGNTPFGGNGGGPPSGMGPGMPPGMPAIGAPKTLEEVDPKELEMSGTDIEALIEQVIQPLTQGIPLDMPSGIPLRPLFIALRSLRSKHRRIGELEKEVEKLKAKVKAHDEAVAASGDAPLPPVLDLSALK